MIGVAPLGTMVASRATFLPGLRTAMMIAAGVSIFGTILTVLFVDRARSALVATPARPSPSGWRETSGHTGAVPGCGRLPPGT